jgi:ankyrin repeat protein
MFGNFQDTNGNTALHNAIQRNDAQAIDLLTKLHVQFEYRKVNNEGLNVLLYAAQHGNSL